MLDFAVPIHNNSREILELGLDVMEDREMVSPLFKLIQRVKIKLFLQKVYP